MNARLAYQQHGVADQQGKGEFHLRQVVEAPVTGGPMSARKGTGK